MSASDTGVAGAGSARSGDMTALNETMEAAAAMKHAVSEAALANLSGRIDSTFLCSLRAARSSAHFSSSAAYLDGSQGGGTINAPITSMGKYRPENIGDPIHEHAHAPGEIAPMRIQQRECHRRRAMARQPFDQRAASEVFAYADLRYQNQPQPGEARGVIGVRVVDDYGSRHREGPVLAGLGVFEAFASSPEYAHVVDQVMLCQIRKGLRGSASAQVVRARAVDEDQTSEWSGDQLRVPSRPGTH